MSCLFACRRLITVTLFTSYRWIHGEIEWHAYVSDDFWVLNCKCCLKIKIFAWTSSHGIYERRRMQARHSLKYKLALPAFVFHTASACTSHQLYFSSSIVQSPATLERRFLCLSLIHVIDKLQVWSRTHSDLSSRRLWMWSAVEYHTHSQCQLMKNQIMITGWRAATHHAATKENVFWPCIDLDFLWPLACTSRRNCIYCILSNATVRLEINWDAEDVELCERRLQSLFVRLFQSCLWL